MTLRWGEESRIVNLEEIGRKDAILDTDEPLPESTRVTLHAGNVRFHGTVTLSEKHQFGWRVRIEFSPMTPWSLETFEPEHLLDPADLK
jgi:hypothetical protein